MAVENANLVHAICGLFCANPPSLIGNNGFKATTLVRASAGVYTLGLVEKLTNTDGVCVCTPMAGTPRMVSAGITPYDPDLPDENIAIRTFDEAGEPADVGEVSLVVYRFPDRA